MIASIHRNEFFNVDKTFSTAAPLIKSVKLVNRFFGLLGSCLFAPPTYAIGGILLFALRREHRKLETDVVAVLDGISDLTIAELRTVHLKVERLKNSYSDVREEVFPEKLSYGIYNSLFGAISKILLSNEETLGNLEITLRYAAYPEQQRQLSANDLEELQQTYLGQDTTDWDDDSLDSYEQHYFLDK